MLAVTAPNRHDGESGAVFRPSRRQHPERPHTWPQRRSIWWLPVHLGQGHVFADRQRRVTVLGREQALPERLFARPGLQPMPALFEEGAEPVGSDPPDEVLMLQPEPEVDHARGIAELEVPRSLLVHEREQGCGARAGAGPDDVENLRHLRVGEVHEQTLGDEQRLGRRIIVRTG